MNQASADQAANLVISLYRGTAERPIVRFPEECRPTSFFDVQKIFDSLIENFGQPVQGWKLYFPFKAGQRNLVAPIFNLLRRSEEHTSELQSLMRISYAVFCLKKKKNVEREKHKRHKSNVHKLTNLN